MRRSALLLGSYFGAGYLPRCPGTFGSLAAILTLLLVPHDHYTLVVAVLALLAIVAGPPLADVMIQATGRKDPQSFVLDEAAGVWIAALRLPGPHIDDLVVAFLLFRLFDIWKPWPVARLERLPGGFGVVYDDVAAGVLALVAGCGLKALLL